MWCYFDFANVDLMFAGLHMPPWPMKELVKSIKQFLQSQKVAHAHQTVRHRTVLAVGTMTTVCPHMVAVVEAQAEVVVILTTHLITVLDRIIRIFSTIR